MTDREIENGLKRAIEAAAPDVLESVMSGRDDLKGQVINMPKKNNTMKRLMSMAAALVLVIGLSAFGLTRLSHSGDVASIVSLDVNPSIELRLNKNAEVLSAAALNKDAEKILDGMKLKGTDINTATNALVGSLLKHGYIDELANSVLISVEDNDAVRGEKLQAELSEEINAILSAASVNASILAQQVDYDSYTEVSREYGISHGKAALISEILIANPTYKFDELSSLSVNELNLILTNPKNSISTVTTTGSVSDSAYIGAEKAKAAAFKHAGIKERDASEIEVDFDYETGKMIYDVEFSSGDYEYDYHIDAVSGDVIDFNSEYDRPVPSKPSPSPSPAPSPSATPRPSPTAANDDIGAEKAKSIALAHAKTSAGAVTALTAERDMDDGRLEYSVEFYIGTTEYDYEIDGKTGAILSFDIDKHEVIDDIDNDSDELENDQDDDDESDDHDDDRDDDDGADDRDDDRDDDDGSDDQDDDRDDDDGPDDQDDDRDDD